MSAPPPAALQNLRSLVFRNHALNLEQEIIFRVRRSNGSEK